MKNFGGHWTDKKLNAFINYVQAYATILNSVKDKYGWKTIYFDGFAGFGERRKKKSIDPILIDYLPGDEEYEIYQGSVKRVLNLPQKFGFDYYYFIDTNKEYIEKLKILCKQFSKTFHGQIILRHDDCNNQLSLLAGALRKGCYASLILLDPFGMQINWASIKQLKGTRSDIWILVPSGVAINRLLDKKMKLRSAKKLESFFGLPKERIEEIFYKTVENPSLFGSIESVNKVSDPINRIVEIYKQQLNTIWKHVTSEPLILTNSKNCPIFHFIFASNNENGLKIASEIIDLK